MGKVVLISNDWAAEQEFDLKHAERILKYQVKRNISPENGWKIKSEHDFVNGKLINRPNKGTDKATSETKGD